MESHYGFKSYAAESPVTVTVEPARSNRDKLTIAFRFILAIPHVLLVGGPMAFSFMIGSSSDSGWHWGGAGALGALAAITAIISWFAIVFGQVQPGGLWKLGAFYLRWRVRAMAYMMLLRDEYPPFDDASYPASVTLAPPVGPRNWNSVAFRGFLAIPHLLAVWLLQIAWLATTVIAWFSILLTDQYPAPLYEFGVGVLRWSTRVEAYLLLLRDEYPPFSLQ